MNQQTKQHHSQVVEQAIQDHQHRKGALLPILHQIQHQLKHVPSSSLATIAKALNLSRAEVHGVVTYYHTFTAEPLGEHVIEVCRAESCQAVGGREIEARAKQQLGIDYGETTADGKISLEPVYCLGHCACSPSIRVGETMHSRMTVEKLDAVLAQINPSS